MKKTKKSKAIRKTVPLTKSLRELIKDEDGFVSKETILKVGLSTVAALGVTSALTTDTAFSQHTNVVVPSGNCANHTNITTHSSY